MVHMPLLLSFAIKMDGEREEEIFGSCLHRKKLSNNLHCCRLCSATTQLLSMSDSELVLHVWPSGWELPSINAECLAVIIYAQLAIPGEFVVEECTDPDLSPNGAQRYQNFSKIVH